MRIIDVITSRLLLLFPKIFGNFLKIYGNIKFPENLQPYLFIASLIIIVSDLTDDICPFHMILYRPNILRCLETQMLSCYYVCPVLSFFFLFQFSIKVSDRFFSLQTSAIKVELEHNVQNGQNSWSITFCDNLTYLTAPLGHQTFLATAANTLQQQAIYSCVSASR